MSAAAAVLVPARDEERTLPALFGALDRTRVEGVLVVDNGSRDDTAGVARAAGARVVGEPAGGYGRACRTGLEALAASADPPELVAILDADDPEAARRLERLLEPLARGRADLVTGLRRGPGGRRAVPLHAAAGNALVAAILRGLYAAPVRDLGPFRAASLEGLLSLGLDDPDFGWNVQMEVRALRRGWRVREVPVLHRRRRTGRSKISGTALGSLRAGLGMVGALVRETLAPPGGPPVRRPGPSGGPTRP